MATDVEMNCRRNSRNTDSNDDKQEPYEMHTLNKEGEMLEAIMQHVQQMSIFFLNNCGGCITQALTPLWAPDICENTMTFLPIITQKV